MATSDRAQLSTAFVDHEEPAFARAEAEVKKYIMVLRSTSYTSDLIERKFKCNICFSKLTSPES